MQNMDFIILFLLTFMFIYVTMSVGLSIYLWVELKSLKNATHNVQFVPVDEKWATTDEKLKEIEELQSTEDPVRDQDDVDETEIDLNKLI